MNGREAPSTPTNRYARQLVLDFKGRNGYFREWAKENKQKCYERTLRWRQRNPEKFKRVNDRYEESKKGKRTRRWLGRTKGAEYTMKYRYKVEGRYQTLVYTSRVRGIECDIPLEIYRSLIEMPCEYCGNPTGLVAGHGLDRKDNRKGYTVENVVSCCRRCNTIKQHYLTHEEMKFLMGKLAEFRSKNVG